MPEEYVIPLSIDVNSIVGRAAQVKTSLTEVGEAAKKAGTDAKSGFDNAGKGATDLSSKLVDNSQKYSLLTKNVEQLKIQLQSYQAIASKSLDPKIITDYNQKVQLLKTQIGQLSNQGKQGFDDLGQAVEKNSNFLTSAFSKVRQLAYILPGVGVAGILAFFTGPIIEYISKLDIFANKLTVAKSNLDNLNEVSKNAAKQYGEQSTNLRILYDATQNVTNSEHDRLLAAQELQKEFPSLFGNIKTETILNGGAAEAYKEATIAILENAKAKAAVSKISELAAKQLEAEFQIQKIVNAQSNETKRAVEQYAKVLEEGDATQGRAKIARDKALQIASDASQNGVLTSIKQRGELSKKAQEQDKKDLQAQIDFLIKFAGGENNIAKALIAGDKLKDPKKAFDTESNFLNQLLKLQNDFTTAEIAGIEDETTRLVAQNDVKYQNQVRTLENQKKLDKIELDNKKLTAGQYEILLRQINLNIAQVTQQGQEENVKIIAQGEAKKLLAQQNSLRAIGVLLKDETDARIEAIRANYAKITAEAKKNGVLTNELEIKLANQEQSDISDVQSKAILDRITRNQQLAEDQVNSGAKNSSESQKQYERRLQGELLDIDIEFAKQRIAALSATLALNGTLTPDQQKAMADAVQKLQKAQNQKTDLKIVPKANIFELLGFSDQNAKAMQDAYQGMFSSLSTIFGSLSQIADQNVQNINKQIDAINALIQTDQSAVDKQQALADKGRANSLDAAKKKLADDQAQKALLHKQAEDAQKKANVLKDAQIAADSAVQAAELTTAIAKIISSYAGLPVIGQVLSIAAIAAMIGAFAAAKVEAFSAVNASSSVTAEDGGIAGGDRHSSGGNKYVSMDGKDSNILEIERGERIFSRKNSEKHKKLFEAIQNNDYSQLDINDISIRDLLRGTGVMQQLEVAQRVGNQNVTLQDRANHVVIVNNNSEKYLSSIDKKMDGLNRREPIIIDYGDYVWIDHGNGYTEKRYK